MEREITNVVRSFAPQEIKSVDVQAKEVTHLISTGAVDRAGDIVEPGGVETANFMRNAVVTANHDHAIESIIGKAVELSISDKGIHARTRFLDTPLGRQAFALSQEGLGGWSIVFRPIDYEPIKEQKGISGYRFKRCELLAYGMVVIPCNQEIVQNALSRGLISEGDVSKFFRVEQAEPAPAVGRALEARPLIVPPLDESLLRSARRARQRLISNRLASCASACLEGIRNGR